MLRGAWERLPFLMKAVVSCRNSYRRAASLHSPWGMAIAPTGFGQFGGDLLVGNFAFGESEINAFDATTGAFIGSIGVDVGGNKPGGLWDLTFGNNGTGNPNTLYFTDGINSEGDGLFGAIMVPEPSTWAMMLIGFGDLGYGPRGGGGRPRPSAKGKKTGTARNRAVLF